MENQEKQMGRRHEEEWERFRLEILNPLYRKVAGGDEKNAKALADILKICQEGERKARLFGGSAEEETELQVCFESD